MRALHQGCIMQLRHHYAVDDYCLHVRIVRPVKWMSREQRKSTCIVCTIVGHGYNGQQKYTICDACRPCHVLNSKYTEASFSPNSTDLLRAHWISNTDTSYCRHSLKIIDFFNILQLADAIELMLLSVLGPIVKCQWNLSAAEEAAITSVIIIRQLNK